MEVSSLTLTVCFPPPPTPSPIFSSALVRGIIQGESAAEEKKKKREICTAYKYSSKVLAGDGGEER